MPIFRINNELHYFAHVPKCGGTSVATYLGSRFGRLGFAEPVRTTVPRSEVWSRTMVQHIPVSALDRLIPPQWFTSSFATVRHPVRRLISSFYFWRDRVQVIPLNTDFNDWCLQEIPRMQAEPFRYDGHLMPQTAFVPKAARAFRLEDGLEQIPPHIDSLAGTSDVSSKMPEMLIGRWRTEESPPVPSAETLALIARAYKTDFARFGYEIPATAGEVTALPDLPALAATGEPPRAKSRPFASRLYRSLLKKADLK